MINEFRIITNLHAQSLILKAEAWIKERLFPDFTVSAKFDWDSKRRSSRGGIYKEGPGINMAMYWAVPNNHGTTYRFYEYASYDKDPSIGGFYSRNPYDKLDAILLHEIAHAVQFFSYKKTNTRCKPHGPVFKQYYKALRTEFINYRLPDQAQLKADYESYVNKLGTNLL